VRKPVRRVLLVVGGLVLLLALIAGAGVAEMFVGLRPVDDGREINGVRIVADGFTTMAMVDSAPGQVLLIDAGMDPRGAALERELARRQLTVQAVTAVFLTHGHADHIGAVPLLPAADVFALAAEAPVAEGRVSPRSPLGRVMPVSPTGVTVDRIVTDGQVVTIGRAEVHVYAVPGHTAGSAAYLVNGVLLVGDSAQITRGGAIRPAPWLVTDDRAENRTSLARLYRRLTMDGARVDAIVAAHSGAADGISALASFAAANP
jgi:glyoxylase-like metal-dependent hydrolase (beta-lactamase superfamily II)